MNGLYIMRSITDRKQLQSFLNAFAKHKAEVTEISLAYGTAVSETLSKLGLEASEKAITTSFVTWETWKAVRYELERRLGIDLPGGGIAYIIPLSSIGGLKQMKYLFGEQEIRREEESVLKDTKYELLTVVSNIGYSNLVMDAAREAGAGGGTVVHARGTGVQGSERFFGVQLASEKEMIYIVVRSSEKNRIMQAIMEKAGLQTRAQAIAFSLPVTEVAGMRLAEMNEAEDREAETAVM